MGARAYDAMPASLADCTSDASMAGMGTGRMDMAPTTGGPAVTQAPEHGTHHADCTSTCCEAVTLTEACTATVDEMPLTPAADVAITPTSVTRAPIPPPPERTA